MEMQTVQQVMTHHVVTVRPDMPLKDVARVLIDSGISGVPVVDDRGHIAGVVSEADFLVKGQGAQAIHHRRLASLLGESQTTRQQLAKVAATTAGEAMTAPAITIEPSRTLQEAAAQMTAHEVNRLPVARDGRLIGIVTRADLVRAYLRTDAELVAAIRDDVLYKILWLDPMTFEVEANRGEVRISGHVERRSTVRAIEEAVAMVPGVISVAVDVTWSVDDRDLQPASIDAVFPHGMV
jgi:CBS domain-containing protein